MALAEALGFRMASAYRVATSVSELANNLVCHATRGGTITLAALRREGEVGIEVVATDEGPGIADVEWALEDGPSTIGGLGSGLSGARRMMDEFEIRSAVGAGTRIVARKWEPCR